MRVDVIFSLIICELRDDGHIYWPKRIEMRYTVEWKGCVMQAAYFYRVYIISVA